MKPELTEEELEIYDKVVELGDWASMFEYGYTIGLLRATKAVTSSLNNL